MTELSWLPVQAVDNWGWQQWGACRTEDPRLFFGPENEPESLYRARVARAVEVCFGCPVMAECRSHGLSIHEEYGIWGGLTEDELRAARSLT